MSLESKALFQICIIITSIFTVSLLAPEQVNAQTEACCEQTIAGESCVYTEVSNCDPQYQSLSAPCEQTPFCRTGCCQDSSGQCAVNVPYASCTQQQGTFSEDPSCSTATCDVGCCVLGNQCSLTTETYCQTQAAAFPSLDPTTVWNSAITDESLCIQQCTQQEEGCCVANDLTCSSSTRGLCGLPSGSGGSGFYSGISCSSSSLPCACTPHNNTGCLPGDEDVYWFDSCGNVEEKAEECNYATGSICVTNNGNAQCASIHCEDTEDFPLNTHDPNMGGFRKNGESWCVYEGPTGPFLDVVGSRHFRHACINGEELVEECRDFREESCYQATTQNNAGEQFEIALCKPNEWQPCVFDCNTPREKGQGAAGKKRAKEREQDEQCCKQYDQCLWVNHSDIGCVPLIPPGLQFWQEGPDDSRYEQAKETCDVRDERCKSVHIKDFSGGWDCVFNCHCEKDVWVNSMNTLCNAVGDCGGYYNVEGQYTLGGFSYGGPRTGTFDQTQIKDFYDFWDATKNNLHVGTIRPITGTQGGWDLNRAYQSFKGTALGLDDDNFLERVLGWILDLIAAVFFWITYIVYWIFDLFGVGDAKSYIHTFDCEPWVAPTTNNCDACNEEGVVCSEYRCKSYGAACDFINEGTTEEKCIWQAPNDVNAPVISPNMGILTPGYTIETFSSTAPVQGYAITPEVNAWEYINFGIQLDEVALCKYSNEITNSYEEMTQTFGNNYYKEQHNMTVALSGGTTHSFYIRCSDTNGNVNVAPYAIQITTNDEPDLTPPQIVGTSIPDGASLPYGINETGLTVYLNEPVETCKWDYVDREFSLMSYQGSRNTTNMFVCDGSSYSGNASINLFNSFVCDGLIWDLQDNYDNEIYIRCKDLVGNVNMQSYSLTLRGTSPLLITTQEPQDTVYEADVQLRVVTQGGAEQGNAFCTFEHSLDRRPTPFFVTDTSVHLQDLRLGLGNYAYDVHCSDVANNIAETSITFRVDVDTQAPIIENIYQDGVMLYIATNEPSTCESSTDHMFTRMGEGTQMAGAMITDHVVSLTSNVYYILCHDQYNNVGQPVTIHVS